MNAPRYLLAKYVPDLRRMEPRNVGVVVWSPDGVAARFVAENPECPGEIDERRVPSFVLSPSAYVQWVHYWRSQIAQPALRPLTGGEAAPRSSPAFLQALQTANKGNFLLTESGFLLDPVPPEELPRVAAHLYEVLVVPPAEFPLCRSVT